MLLYSLACMIITLIHAYYDAKLLHKVHYISEKRHWQEGIIYGLICLIAFLLLTHFTWISIPYFLVLTLLTREGLFSFGMNYFYGFPITRTSNVSSGDDIETKLLSYIGIKNISLTTVRFTSFIIIIAHLILRIIISIF